MSKRDSDTSFQPYQHSLNDDQYDDEDWAGIGEDSNQLRTTNSLLDYSDTSDDFSANVSPVSFGTSKRTINGQRRDRTATGRAISKKHSRSHDYYSKAKRNGESVDVSRKKSRDIANGDSHLLESPNRTIRAQQEMLIHDENNYLDYPLSGSSNRFSWFTNLAFSFRSPQTTLRKASTSTGSIHHDNDSGHYGVDETTSMSHQQPVELSTLIRNRVGLPCTNTDSRQTSSGSLDSDSRLASEDSPLLGISYYPDDNSTRDKKESRRSRRRETSKTCQSYKTTGGQPHTLIALAASFLQDYEANRPPTFASVYDLRDVTRYHLSLYGFRYSNSFLGFPAALKFAALCMFASSALEGFNSSFIFGQDYHNSARIEDVGMQTTTNLSLAIASQPSVQTSEDGLMNFFLDMRLFLTLLNILAISIVSIDLWMGSQLSRVGGYAFRRLSSYRGKSNSSGRSMSSSTLLDHDPRRSRSDAMVKLVIIFCVILALENIARLVVKEYHVGNNGMITDKTKTSFVLFASIFKPIILFYISSQARDALEALLAIMDIVLRVLLLEMILILMFATVACRLYPEHQAFSSLPSSWLALFELTTTVNNPSVWMSIYATDRSSVLFFITFVIVSVFYLHSLVLSVVFQVYIKSAAEVHERMATDKDDALYLSFLSLMTLHEEVNGDNNESVETDKKKNTYSSSGAIDVELVRETLILARPHYNATKITALVDMVDQAHKKTVDFPTFRAQIRHALNASIRTARVASVFALIIELVAVVVGVVNFVYVMMMTTMALHPAWSEQSQVYIGLGITILAAFELIARFNPFRIRDFTPATRLNLAFDGLAMVAAIISFYGVALHLFGKPSSMDWILMGRAIDMMRAMRFFPIFRDVVRRSVDVVPVLVGPLILIFTTVHMFCYLGLALWGGAVHVGAHSDQINNLYDLNNFNSYTEGIVTIFQVLVLNDWNAIAQVFTFADRCSSPWIVYPFFICFILIGVSIMLNVMTAFFVQSFVTKINDDKDAPAEATTTVPKEYVPTGLASRDISFHLSDRDPISRITTNCRTLHQKSHHRQNGKHQEDNDVSNRETDADSESSTVSEMVEFDVYEREGYDKLMQTVTGSYYHGDFPRQVCHYLEVFEGLSPYRDSVGYLICDQLCLERYGNRRFKTKSIGCLEENELHSAVTEIHNELINSPPSANAEGAQIVRVFPHKRDSNRALEISASLLRRHPALSIFVSRTIKAMPAEGLAVKANPPTPSAQRSTKQKSKTSRKTPK